MAIRNISALPPLVQGRVYVHRAQGNSSNLWQNFSHQIQLWPARRRQRARLRELAELNDYLLQDIGLTPRDALMEAAKPFWKR